MAGNREDEEEGRCPLCGGTGWVVPDVPPGHPDFGQARPCVCTLREFEKKKLFHLERYSNLGPLSSLTFETLNPYGLEDDPRSREQFHRCYKAAQQFAQNPSGWLVLIGPSGCGKTHLAAAIANRCLRQGISVFFVVVADLLDHLRATFSPGSEVTYDELFDRVRNAPLLVLDDLGTYSSTPWAEEKLFQILNHRFNGRLPTVVTTISLENLDERLKTRLGSGLAQRLVLKGPPLLRTIGSLSQEAISRMRLDNFDVQGMNADPEQRESLKLALQAAREFARSPENWLVLVGPHGSGKTHLAVGIVNQLLDSGRPVLFAETIELLDQLHPSFGPGERREPGQVLEEVKNTSVLVLDDLRVEMASAWAREKLYQILNYRYNLRLPTTITATHPSLEALEEQLRSRLMDPRISNVVPIGAPDYRGQRRTPRRRRR